MSLGRSSCDLQIVKWNPHIANKNHLTQSAFLQMALHQAFFLLHRAFISPLGDSNKPPSPSLVICTNSARAGSGVLDTLRRRDVLHLCHSSTCLTAFHAAIILLLSIWGSSGSGGASVNYSSQISDVHVCMQTLSDLQHRWVMTRPALHNEIDAYLSLFIDGSSVANSCKNAP